MKKIIILFLMLNSLFCFSESKKNTKQMINEDCEYLKKYVTNAYANYDLDVEKGFDIDETIKTIKSSYKKNYGYKNNLRINDFGWLIGFTLGQDLPIKDNHLTIKTPEFDSTLFSQENAYYSDIYFEKVGTEYKIKYSSLVNFSKGMTYTDDEQYLVPVFYKNEWLYRYVLLQDSFINDVSININNCKKKIETKRNSLINIPRKEIGYKSTDKNIYISLGTCDVSDRIVREFVIKQILLVIEKLKNENLEKNVILDIRNNTGGREEIIDSLIFGIFYRETYSSNRNYEEMFEVGEKGSFQLFSKETEEANNIQLPESKRNKNLENYQKHILGSPTDRLNYLPQFGNEKMKGKLYILMDRRTVSAAEFGIAFAYMINKNKIVLVGEKTIGAGSSNYHLSYTLPNSKIQIRLGNYSYYYTTSLSQNKRWNGDTKGFYPDYWCTQDTILPTLIELTKDEKLATELAGLEKGMVY
jgi:hypothetical protein